MNNYKIKICGIKEAKSLDCCITNSIDFFGLVFYKESPRNVNIDEALSLINHVYMKEIIPIGVFVNKQIDELKEIIKKTSLKYIQLHGKEDNNYIKILKNHFNVKIIKSLGIKNKDDLEKIKNFNSADYFLFDSKPTTKELPGGNSKKFDWSLLQNIKMRKPWFISGGINIDNIEEIKKNLTPYGIDISSGVEEERGIKSLKKINDLMRKINAK